MFPLLTYRTASSVGQHTTWPPWCLVGQVLRNACLNEWIEQLMNEKEALGLCSGPTTSPPERIPRYICSPLSFGCELPNSNRLLGRGCSWGLLPIWPMKEATDQRCQRMATFLCTRSTPSTGSGRPPPRSQLGNGPDKAQPCLLANWKLFLRMNIHVFLPAKV